MSLGGTYIDHSLTMFSDMLMEELQRNGSILEQTVSVEAMTGQKAYFDKIGALSSYRKTQRNQQRTYQDATFERRPITFQMLSGDHILDETDLMDMVTNPESEIVQGIVKALGRDQDVILLAAIKDAAIKIINGSSSTGTLGSAQKVAVNDHKYDKVAGTNDIGLTTFKLKNALAKLAAAEVDIEREQIFCVAPANQLTNLKMDVEVISHDYNNNKPLYAGPGLDNTISGYLGITFIRHEGLGNDTNADNLVFVYPKSAVKMGVRQPLIVKKVQAVDIVGVPYSLSITKDIGATRMFEEKVIQISCDPTVTLSS